MDTIEPLIPRRVELALTVTSPPEWIGLPILDSALIVTESLKVTSRAVASSRPARPTRRIARA